AIGPPRSRAGASEERSEGGECNQPGRSGGNLGVALVEEDRPDLIGVQAGDEVVRAVRAWPADAGDQGRSDSGHESDLVVREDRGPRLAPQPTRHPMVQDDLD